MSIYFEMWARPEAQGACHRYVRRGAREVLYCQSLRDSGGTRRDKASAEFRIRRERSNWGRKRKAF